MSELTLYYAIPSRGLVTHWMLEEIGEPFQRRVLDIQQGEHRSPEVLALNPLGRVPILVHGDRVITETTATLLYLAEQFPAAGLDVPVSDPARGELLRWLFFNPGTLEAAMFASILGFEAEGPRPMASTEEIADLLCGALGDREFLIGDRFTVADVAIGSGVNWAMNMMDVLPRRPELADYWARLEARPAWQAVLRTMA